MAIRSRRENDANFEIRFSIPAPFSPESCHPSPVDSPSSSSSTSYALPCVSLEFPTSLTKKLTLRIQDYTCWDLYIEFYSSPIKQIANETNAVRDRNGQKVSFYREIPSILLELKKAGVGIAIASRTHATEEALEALKVRLSGLRLYFRELIRAWDRDYTFQAS